MKIVLIGATSKTGEAIVNLFQPETKYRLIKVTSDLEAYGGSDINTVKINSLNHKDLKNYCLAERPDVIINTSGLSDAALCEEDKNLAREINIAVVENLVKISRIIDSHLIIISTDNVFDGKKGPYAENDKPNPINYFGKTKHSAENLCLSLLNKYTIIRASLIYGNSSYDKREFISDLLEKLVMKQQVFLSNSQIITPLFIDDLAYGILKIIEKKKYGIYHFSSGEAISRFDAGLQVCEVFGLDKQLIQLLNNGTLKTKVRMPENAGLINLKAVTDLNLKFTNFLNGLVTYKFRMKVNNYLFNKL